MRPGFRYGSGAKSDPMTRFWRYLYNLAEKVYALAFEVRMFFWDRVQASEKRDREREMGKTGGFILDAMRRDRA